MVARIVRVGRVIGAALGQSALFVFDEVFVRLRLARIPAAAYRLMIRRSRSRRDELLARLGFVHERAGELRQAAEAYAAACDAAPDNPMHYFGLACVYERQANWRPALENYQKALELGKGLSPEFRGTLSARIAGLRERPDYPR
jgi:tetratricopeptide (TPR) repeat protein